MAARMPLPLLLLLLLLLQGSATATVSALRQVCAGHARPGTVLQASQCPEPPCWTKRNLTLALPVQLTPPELFFYNTLAWDLSVQDASGAVIGAVAVLWVKAMYMVLLEARRCHGQVKKVFQQYDTLLGDGQFHVQVAAAGHEVTFSLVVGRTQGVHTTLPFPDHLPPYTLTVRSQARYGYSALNTTTTSTNSQTSTTTTTITTNSQTSTTTTTTNPTNTTTTTCSVQPVVVAITTLVAMTVVGSVAMVVLALDVARGEGAFSPATPTP